MDLSVLPNLITLLRLLLVVPIAASILGHHFGTALLLFAVASVSDGIDGFLARRFDWISRFGSMLDPIADKILLVTVFVLLTFTGYIPVWLAVVVIARDLIILTGATVYHILFGEYEFAPTFLGKFSTASQFTLVILMLVDLSVTDLPAWLLSAMIWLVFAVSSLSGVDYVYTWTRKALAASRTGK